MGFPRMRESRSSLPFVLSLSKDKRHFQINVAGGSPAASYLLLSRQKKVTQEKATPVRRPFGLPCGTRPSRRLRNSALAGLRQSSPTSPAWSPFLGGRTGGRQKSLTDA